MMYKKMIHDIRYLGLAGKINFSKEPYMYQDTDLFNYNIEYDLNYFPSGRGGKVKRFKQPPQVNTLTLGVINRTDVRELVSKLERHFQVDINAKTPAQLFINGSYTECYIVSSVKTYFNRFLGINFITLEILREKPVWTIEEEYSYQKANLQTNPYDLNLIKPPYDFSNFEFTQPARPLKEANLIKNGWDDFAPYGSGKNYVENWDFEGDMSAWMNGVKNKDNVAIVSPDLGWTFRQNVDFEKGDYVIRIKARCDHKDPEFSVIVSKPNSDVKGRYFYPELDKSWGVYETIWENSKDAEDVRVHLKTEKGNVEVDWIQITPVDNQHLVVEKTPLGNGMTRIQTWGGSRMQKIGCPIRIFEDGEKHTISMFIINNVDRFRITNNLKVGDWVEEGEERFYTLKGEGNGKTHITVYVDTQASNNLDFIASDPVIYEDDGSMIYDIQEYEDKYRLFTMNSHSRTKMKLPIKKSIFKNEQYTHSIYAENLSEKDVLITSGKGIYINDPVIEVKPNEKGVYAYTGTVVKDNLYTTFEIATKEPKDDINIILDKPAVRYGDQPFDWPPEEEIVPLKLPTHIPFLITVDDSVKYISNNSIGDTLAKITVFGPIKNPTLYIESNTYRVYEELLENERIEIDQRAKTVIKVTASGDRVNVFHLRDKEHSIFKPIPEGENAITQNDDFSYTIILYHERNEPKWT